MQLQRTVTPHASYHSAQQTRIEMPVYQVTPLPDGSLLLLQQSQRGDLQVSRLKDSSTTDYIYLTQYGRMIRTPLGLIVGPAGTAILLTGEYHEDDSMMVIARHINTATGREQEADTIVKLPVEEGSYYRTGFASALSQDSSRMMIYTFGLNRDATLPPMADAILYEFAPNRKSTMRFPIALADNLKRYAYGKDYLPLDIADAVMLDNHSRAYFIFPGNNDSVGVTYANFVREEKINHSISLREFPSDPKNWRYCRPNACIAPNGDLFLAVLDYQIPERATGISTARFSPATRTVDSVRHHILHQDKIFESRAENMGELFMIVGMVSNPATEGCTILFRREKSTFIYGTMTYTKGSLANGYNRSYDIPVQGPPLYFYGDIYGMGFGKQGQKVWQRTVIPTNLRIEHRMGPHLHVTQGDDSIRVTYLEKNTALGTTVSSATISQKDGTAKILNVADLGINTYAHIRNSFPETNGNWVIIADLLPRDYPDLIRLHRSSPR